MTDPTNTDNAPPALRLIVAVSAGGSTDPTATENGDPALRLIVPPATSKSSDGD